MWPGCRPGEAQTLDPSPSCSVSHGAEEGLWHTSVIESKLNQLLHDVPTALSRLTQAARMALMTYGGVLKRLLTPRFGGNDKEP